MAAREIKKDHVKQWVVQNASVTNPYKKYWSASVTLGYDYAEQGDTIEKAYQALTDFIFKSPHVMCKLSDIESFRKIVNPNV